MENPVFVTEKSGEGLVPEKEKAEVTSTVAGSESSSSSSHPPSYDEIEAQNARSEEEEKILNVLKEVVKKTTLANPLKRPSAQQVVKMLEDVMPRDVIQSLDRFDVSDDDDDDETVVNSVKKLM